jgi:transposase-like protein
MEQKRTREKKKEFLEHLIRSGRYISRTCRAIGINRGIFYDWKRQDPAFALNLRGEEREDFRKDMFTEAWAKMRHRGISDLCRKLEISRWTYYNWCKKDAEFVISLRIAWKTECELRDEIFRRKHPNWRKPTFQY